MGYIPPVKDDQLLLYSSRQQRMQAKIPVVPVTQEIKFKDTVKGQSFPDLSTPKFLGKINISHRSNEIECIITGKGRYIDELI